MRPMESTLVARMEPTGPRERGPMTGSVRATRCGCSTRQKFVGPQHIELRDRRARQRPQRHRFDRLVELVDAGDPDHTRCQFAVAEYEAQGRLRRRAADVAERRAYRGG